MGKIILEEKDIILGSMKELNIAVEWSKAKEYKLAFHHALKAYNYQSEWVHKLNEIIEENNLENKLKEKGLEY
jgi:hypothetical protein